MLFELLLGEIRMFELLPRDKLDEFLISFNDRSTESDFEGGQWPDERHSISVPISSSFSWYCRDAASGEIGKAIASSVLVVSTTDSA